MALHTLSMLNGKLAVIQIFPRFQQLHLVTRPASLKTAGKWA